MPDLVQLLREELAGLVDVALALGALLGDQLLDLVVLARVEGGEGEVLQLPLDRVDPQPVGERREDLERLASLLVLLLLRQRAERPHVVEAVGQLDQDHPDVGGHRHHHLPVVLGLALVAALEGDPGELGHAVHQCGDLVAEALADLLEAGAGVLDGVVKQGRAQGRGVQPQAGADPGDPERVSDEVLAGLALLVGVALAGEGEGALDLLAVDRLGERRTLCSSITAKRSPSSARCSVVSSLVIESARGVRARGRARRRACGRGGPRAGPAVGLLGVSVLATLCSLWRNLLASWCLARQARVGPRSLQLRPLRG